MQQVWRGAVAQAATGRRYDADMLPPGYRWRDADSPSTRGWIELLNAKGKRAALVQPYAGRFYITVQMDGMTHQMKKGSAVTLERAKMHVERWAMERTG